MEIIINADDFGISSEVNEAIKYCFSKKLIHFTSLMVNMPYTKEAVEIARNNGFLDRIGLHLNLVEGKPLTQEITKTRYCDLNGFFNGSIMNGKNRLFVSKQELKAIKIEIKAQIDKFLDYVNVIHRIDSHRHSHINYPILKIVLRILRNFNDCQVRLCRNIPKEKRKIFKNIYKKCINKKISRYNKLHNNCNIKYFGSIDDLEKFENNKKIDSSVEIMVHPIIQNGVLLDAINIKSIEEWLNER